MDIIPHSNRIAELRLEGTTPITILAVYAPQSGRTQEEKTAFCDQVKAIVQKILKKGP